MIYLVYERFISCFTKEGVVGFRTGEEDGLGTNKALSVIFASTAILWLRSSAASCMLSLRHKAFRLSWSPAWLDATDYY